MKNVNWKRKAGILSLVILMLGNSSLLHAVRLYAAPASAIEFQDGTAALVNVNKATADELEAIQGIGPTLAQRIIQYRDEHGPFKQPDDLMNVNGIGGAKLQKIKAQVTV